MSKVALFFSSYSNFTLNEDAAVTKEFLRLKKLKRWKDGDDEYTEARERFADALAEDFNAMYGTNIDDIEHWRVLCHVLKIDPVPEDIKACRKAVKSKHVNLVDLVQHTDKVRVFSTVKELAKYSKKQKRYSEAIGQGWRNSSLPPAPYIRWWFMIQDVVVRYLDVSLRDCS
ncbi:hypothetical protein BC826DRAFT_1105174 [Russula brevipes]|nr:hypothetical protein BC826DRAFT_1105174 [Russula brevipes]